MDKTLSMCRGVMLILSKTRKAILELLKHNRHGMACYELSRLLRKDPSQMNKCLKQMVRHSILESIISKPVIYRINLKGRGMVFFFVKCPKCQCEYKVGEFQVTKVCENPECLRPNGERTRFYLFDRRIVRVERVI